MFERLKNRWFNAKTASSPLVSNAAIEPDILINLRQVVKEYITPAGAFTALKGVDLQISRGEFVAVIGKSGSGKSTLINMVTGIDLPTLGEIHIAGAPIQKLNRRQMARWRGRNVGIIFQFFQLLPTLSVIENIILPMEFCGLYTLAQRRERAMHLLELVGMAEQADKLPAMISGGQQQRVAIARALANDPQILVADEPTGSLDSKTADTIFQLFEEFVTQGRTILMVTHDRDLASRVSRVVLIADGEIADQPISHALPSLDKKMMVQISAKLTPVNYKAGSIIFREGDVADQFYIIIKGQVEIVKQHESGQDFIVATLSTGQYFGEMGLIENSQRNATARASGASEVILMALDKDTFGKLMTDSELTYSAIARLMRQRTTINHLLEILPPPTETPLLNKEVKHELITYKPGTIIYQRGDVADKFYLIVKGYVDVMHPYQHEVPITRLVSGQYFGEGGVLHRSQRERTVRAAPDSETDVKLIAIERDTFRQLITGNTILEEEIALSIRHYLSEQLVEFIPNLQRRARKSDLLKDTSF